jgi:hypothetical protein
MKQLIHAPSFLLRYQEWWMIDRPLLMFDIDHREFAVLILRICSFAAQFVPSNSLYIDSIGNVSLLDIRNTCNEVGDSLANACIALDPKGSLIRVQHLLFAALKFTCEGKTAQFWEGIGAAAQATKKAGIHRDHLFSMDVNGDLEKEMQRRVFCCLYVLDRYVVSHNDHEGNITNTPLQIVICLDSLIAFHLYPTT